MSEDTYEGDIWSPQNLNWYVYVENNPLRYVDPSGNIKSEPYDLQQLDLLLKEAREKINFSKKSKYYQVYKDYIWEKFEFESFMA